MNLTYKYKLRHPSYGRRLRRHAVALNQVWNYAATRQKKLQKAYREGSPGVRWPSEFDLDKATAGTSMDLETSAGSIQKVIRKFTQSRAQAQKAPRFRHSYGPKRALGWVPFRTSDRKISGNSIRFYGKTYRWVNDRPLPPVVRSGAFVEDALGRWWVCLQVEIPDDENHGDQIVGIDLGLKNLATLSTGKKIENPHVFNKWAQKLAINQRARNNRRVKAIHKKIRNSRNDYQHKETRRLIRECQFIAIGNLSSKALAKTKMAKSVLDAAWGGFIAKLCYKASRHGVRLIKVHEKFTTQTCSHCLDIPDSSPKGRAGLGMRVWKCSSCSTSHDRDRNAAQNILRLGLSAQPLVEEIGSSNKN